MAMLAPILIHVPI